MGVGTHPSVAGNDLCDATQRIQSRYVAVHQSKSLAIVDTDAYFKTALSGN
jgi:hypothetical protein